MPHNSKLLLLKDYLPSLRNLRKHGVARYFFRCLRLALPINRNVLDLVNEFTFDLKFGVNTSRVIPSQELNFNNTEIQEHAVLYRPSPPYRVRNALEALKKYDPRVLNHTFLDFGCGAGRIIIIAAEAGFENIVGIELSPQLLELCCQNINRYRTLNKTPQINVLRENAAEYVIPDDVKVLYFYSPFSFEIYSKIIVNINKSLMSNPRTIYVLEMASNYDFESHGYQLIDTVNSIKLYKYRKI